MFGEETIIAIISIVASAFGAIIWKWVSNIETKIENIEKILHNYSPIIDSHIERLDIIEREVEQLINKELDINEKLTHMVQIVNKEYYRINSLAADLAECKKNNGIHTRINKIDLIRHDKNEE